MLAGPIVRRVTARSVSVWVSLSESATVTLRIWDKVISGGVGPGPIAVADIPLQSASATTIRVGAKLHVALVTAKLPAPGAPLFPGSRYSYNLGFSNGSDLKSLGLLEDRLSQPGSLAPHLALGYSTGTLPTFVTAPVTIDKLNLAHTSCRKAHGPGKDSLATLDELIRKGVTQNDPDLRPHQLFLTGDQIYADEVPTLLLPAINALGAELLGTKENLTAKKADNSVGTFECTLANFPATRRSRIVTKNAQFTSIAAANHLLSFGEFAATYLMYWNGAVWPDDLFAARNVLKTKSDYLATWDTDPLTAVETDLAPPDAEEQAKFAKEEQDNPGKRKEERKKSAKEGYEEELSEVIAFRNQLPSVRRVLANVPTYMIMDDHEVTDDWYITRDWRDRVLSAPLGVNILRNGLLSYALFQDLGNDPDAWLAGSKRDLLTRAGEMFPGSAASGPVTAAADAIDALFGFDLHDETAPPVTWHYSVPSSETKVFVLDTRTRRTFASRFSPPGLLSDSAMDDQIPLAAQPERFLVFVSPAPVLGLGVMEELVQPAITMFNPFYADPEAWAFDPVVFENFIGRLEKFKRVVLLSGDVHYSLSSHMDYWKKNEPTPARLVQFVSSSAKNQKFGQEQFLAAGFIQQLLGSLYYPAERLGWTLRAGLNVSNGAGRPNPPSHRIRLRREPVLLPTQGWPTGTTVNLPTDWSWRINFSVDERPDDTSADARPEKVRISAITPDVDATTGDAGAAYKKVLTRHVEIFRKNVARRVMWDSHLGVIRFLRDSGGALTAIQELWSWLPADDITEDPDLYTSYAVSLEPTTQPRPAIT